MSTVNKNHKPTQIKKGEAGTNELLSLNNQVNHAKNFAEAIIATVHEPLVVLDKNLRVKTANHSFYKIFQVNVEETENHLIYELGNGQWNIPELRTLLENILPEKSKLYDYELRHHFANIGKRTLLLNAREIKSDGNSEKLILLAIEDVTEKRFTNDRIKESKERYFRLLKNLPAAIYTCDAQGYLTYYNDAAVELWGRKPEIGKDMWSGSWKMFRTDGSLIPLDECPMAIALKTGSWKPGPNEEFIFEHPDGTRKYLIPYPQADIDLLGKVTGGVNIMIDITNLRKTEHLLRQNEQRFRNLVEESTIAMAVLHGPEKILILANEAMLTLWGRDKSVFGKKLLDFLPELANQPFPKLLDEVFTTGKAYTDEDSLVFLKRNGRFQKLYTDFSYTALRNSDNEITDILISAIDVTENYIFKKQLQESEQNFRNIIEQSPVAMCVLRGPEFMVEIANERIYEVWGKKETEVLHRPLFTGLPEVKDQGIKDLLEKVYLTGEKFTASEYSVKLNRGGKLETIYVNFVYQALKENNGNISGIVVVAIDVTDQIKARRESEFLQQQKDDFIGIASHELKTPVTIIKAYSQMLGKILSEKGNLYESGMANKMDEQANRLNSLIVDLLDTTKINSGKLQFNNVDFDFNELVKEILDDMKYTTQTHSIIHETDGSCSCMVHADKERIGQVIDNFLTNAIKYSPKADKVIVRTGLKKGEVHLSVQDFGIGINADKKDKVFEQFYRVTGNGKPNTYPGIGLGLFIAAEIIKRENGKIWVESEEGKGSSFCFSLPCKGKECQ
jgi:PAS domain S-box-containing protein